jgi:hypothetical protein
MTLRRLEDALAMYDTEKAVEDAACMVPHLLNGDAIRGVVSSIDDQHRVVVRVNAVPRALIVLDTDDPVVLPAGKRLWWTATAHDHPWEVQAIQANGKGSRVILMQCAPPTPERLPKVGDRVTVSVLHTRSPYRLSLPQNPPWTHRPAVSSVVPEPIDVGDGEAPPAAVDGATLPDAEAYT